MGKKLDDIVKAGNKALDEAKKLQKAYKDAKTPQEKEKYKKMAEGAKKIANAFADMVVVAAKEDKAEMLEILDSIK